MFGPLSFPLLPFSICHVDPSPIPILQSDLNIYSSHHSIFEEYYHPLTVSLPPPKKNRLPFRSYCLFPFSFPIFSLIPSVNVPVYFTSELLSLLSAIPPVFVAGQRIYATVKINQSRPRSPLVSLYRRMEQRNRGRTRPD